MAIVGNVTEVIKALRDRAARFLADGVKPACIVGYTANYALYVHENMEQKLKGLDRPSGLGVYWGPNGGPKYLEGPFRRRKRESAAIIKDALAKGRTLGQALLLAGLPLQAESMENVPVEMGFLRASAFTRLVRED
jgi:hypothetical protein